VFLLWFAFVRRNSSPEKLQRAKKFPHSAGTSIKTALWGTFAQATISAAKEHKSVQGGKLLL